MAVVQRRRFLPYSIGPERLKERPLFPKLMCVFIVNVVSFAKAGKYMVITSCFDGVEHAIRD